MARPIIEIQQLSKRYRLGSLGARSLREDFELFVSRLRRRETRIEPARRSGWVWALRKIDLQVQKGEVLGLIGGNGAGKSTLLKILSRITEPTEGEAILRGKVASLLEVGTGFNPELTGKENIFLNAAVLGMRSDVTRRKLNDIIAFSEVEEYINTPVKRYSSGMRVRLAFAVAAFLEPEILIVDEVLAVGDHRFQQKCLGKMNDVAKHGRTVLFVSHDLAAVQNLCSRVVALRKGELFADGSPADAIREYLSGLGEESTVADIAPRENLDGPHIASATVSQGEETVPNFLMSGQPAHFQLSLEAVYPGANVIIEIYSEAGAMVTRFSSPRLDLASAGERTEVVCVMDPLRLTPGRYRLAGSLWLNGFQHHHLEHLASFQVSPGFIDRYRVDTQRQCGLVHLAHRWQVSATPAQPPSSPEENERELSSVGTLR